MLFFGSAFMELEPVGGAYMAGSMIIDVDKDAKELVIPETATYFLHNIHNVKVKERKSLFVIIVMILHFRLPG